MDDVLRELKKSVQKLEVYFKNKENEEIYEDVKKLYSYFTKPYTSIDNQVDLIDDILAEVYEPDVDGKITPSKWNDNIDEARDGLWEIKNSYHHRLIDAHLLNELKEITGIESDYALKNWVKEKAK